jgi:transglutaminase-like putative cysteine protease
MRYLIDYKASVSFAEPVREHQCELRVVPPDTAAQRVHVVRIATEPAAVIGSYVDYFGNRVHHFGLIAPHDRVEIVAQSEVETLLANPFEYPLVPAGQERDWVQRALTATPALWDYVLHRSALVPDRELLARPDTEWPEYDAQRPLRDLVFVAIEWVNSVLAFDPDAEPHADLKTALAIGNASCRDMTHLLIAVVRSWGFPGRYVCGHADAEPLETEPLDATLPPLRAWAEVLIPGGGWRGFDAVTGLVANDAYIGIALGRDASEAPLCRSSWKGADEHETQAVSLRVKRTHDQ